MGAKGTAVLREQNVKKVLEYLRSHEPCSRLEITNSLNVSKNTVSLIIDQLMKENVVAESGTAERAGAGRPRIKLKLVPGAFQSIGMMLQKEKIEFVILDYQFNEIDRGIVRLREEEEMINSLIHLSKELIERYPRTVGIGIAIPGLVDQNSGCVYHAAKLNWNQVQLKQIMENALNKTVSVFNNVKVSALRGLELAKQKDISSAFYIRIDEGIGGAFLIDKQIFSGASWTSGEIGHISVEQNGPPCSCGQQGCLEKMISIATFRQSVQHFMPQTSFDFSFSSKDLIKRIKQHQELINQVIQYGEFLGRAIVQVIHLINPKWIIIDAPYNELEEFKQKTLKSVQIKTLPFSFQETNITFTENMYSPATGAAVSIFLTFENQI